MFVACEQFCSVIVSRDVQGRPQAYPWMQHTSKVSGDKICSFMEE